MSPLERSPLLESDKNVRIYTHEEKNLKNFDDLEDYRTNDGAKRLSTKKETWAFAGITAVISVAILMHSLPTRSRVLQATGPYKLVEHHTGPTFFDHYDFYDGEDSLGSAGHQVYVNQKRATELGIFNTTIDENGREAVYMTSAPSVQGKRESIRLEGKRRFDRGLFVLDLDHMPTGAGVWPAFWMTDEAHWPDNGEIDILETINHQTRAKTALHTSGQCRMYGQIPKKAMTGTWDRATGIPDPLTNASNYATDIEADDCWNLAAHRWYNQGCVLMEQEGTIGKPVNDRGGGIYALEWDPLNGYIKSWTFLHGNLPQNLERAMATSGGSDKEAVTTPDPKEWGVPYAYFAIGPQSDCSEDHFQHMRLVFNLAFCGEVAGNRFFKDCPDESQRFNVSSDPILSCNAYLESEPEALEEAYWKIRGVYAWERELQWAGFTPAQHGSFRS